MINTKIKDIFLNFFRKIASIFKGKNRSDNLLEQPKTGIEENAFKHRNSIPIYKEKSLAKVTLNVPPESFKINYDDYSGVFYHCKVQSYNLNYRYLGNLIDLNTCLPWDFYYEESNEHILSVEERLIRVLCKLDVNDISISESGYDHDVSDNKYLNMKKRYQNREKNLLRNTK